MLTALQKLTCPDNTCLNINGYHFSDYTSYRMYDHLYLPSLILQQTRALNPTKEVALRPASVSWIRQFLSVCRPVINEHTLHSTTDSKRCSPSRMNSPTLQRSSCFENAFLSRFLRRWTAASERICFTSHWKQVLASSQKERGVEGRWKEDKITRETNEVGIRKGSEKMYIAQ